jgi:hypothetical protein
MSVAGGEVIAQASKPGSRPWDLEPAQYVELFVGSKGQRTFGLGGLWRTAKTEAVESDEDAAALRETDDPEFASVSYDDVRELRLARFETMTWLTGSLRNEALRSEWLIRLESVFGFALTVVRDPSAMTDDDGGCGGDAPTVAQGAESGGAEADVAPVPGITNSVDEAPESIWTVFRSTPPVRVASAQTADTGFPLPSVSVVGSVAESVEGRFSSQPLPIGASPLYPVPFAPDFPLMRGEKRSGGITWP